MTLLLAACGGHDEEPDSPDDLSSEISEGTINVGGYIVINGVYPGYYGPKCYLTINVDKVTIYTGGIYGGGKIVRTGKVSDITDIKQVPVSGWGTVADFVDGSGYVVQYIDSGTPYYVRLVLKYNKDVSGEIVGINYLKQEFTPTNLH